MLELPIKIIHEKKRRRQSLNHEKRSKKLGENVLVVVSVILVGITLYGLWLIYSVWKDKPHEIAELQHVDFEAPVIDGVTYLPADDGEIGPENCAAIPSDAEVTIVGYDINCNCYYFFGTVSGTDGNWLLKFVRAADGDYQALTPQIADEIYHSPQPGAPPQWIETILEQNRQNSTEGT